MSIDDSFPTPRPEDSDDVELALETAGALWNKGDRPEALRWLRRAAEAAEQSGDDRRALELARRAAELDTAPEPVPAQEPVIEPPKAEEAAPEGPAEEEAARSEGAPVAPAEPEGPPEPSRRESVRVYVKTSARDNSLLIVRPLEAGWRAPFGTREATLVFEEPS
jgi:hypothetical protein